MFACLFYSQLTSRFIYLLMCWRLFRSRLSRINHQLWWYGHMSKRLNMCCISWLRRMRVWYMLHWTFVWNVRLWCMSKCIKKFDKKINHSRIIPRWLKVYFDHLEETDRENREKLCGLSHIICLSRSAQLSAFLYPIFLEYLPNAKQSLISFFIFLNLSLWTHQKKYSQDENSARIRCVMVEVRV